ncbi:hypothetical protein PNK_p0142 (plasmid) [Candidatus Protochlamydia naegleriophila]|uniref:Uncharacterized protein n=1 Tax=Candidatus Protochlamydia naegleriophila TaxID=389348 RepID=A0A0U5JHV7_9BACT|nr:hypothetical protein PNK_p0142 [Candidatus Protochlamydia naegleriophila]
MLHVTVTQSLKSRQNLVENLFLCIFMEDFYAQNSYSESKRGLWENYG